MVTAVYIEPVCTYHEYSEYLIQLLYAINLIGLELNACTYYSSLQYEGTGAADNTII